MSPRDPDHALRLAAIEHVRGLDARYDQLVPLAVLRAGFPYAGRRVPFNSFQSGIFRPRVMSGTAALSLYTTPPVPGKPRPYDDDVAPGVGGAFTYHYRDARQDSVSARAAAARDNATLVAAFEQQAPLIWFVGHAKKQYQPLAPVFVSANDPVRRVVELQAGVPVADLIPAGEPASADLRRYATGEARVRLHQTRFRAEVMRAYARRCAICRLHEADLLQAAHILEDRHEHGEPVVVNGIALCAIHHLAYDRNLLGIDPDGVVHIAHRLLEEVDGPMLRAGLQERHGEGILLPRKRSERPDPARLEIRFGEFERAAA